MTSLVCWVGKDTRKVASIYLASDSRLTDLEDGRVLSDTARKIFSCSQSANLFGYCGNAVGPPAALLELTNSIDDGCLIFSDTDETARAEAIRTYLDASVPLGASAWKHRDTHILYATRTGSGYMNARFFAYKFFVSDQDRWDWNGLELPDTSDIVAADGSGADEVRRWQERWASAQGRNRTSRAVFSALCAVLERGSDRRSGGPPQLVGIYQRGPAVEFGVLFGEARYFRGACVPQDAAQLWHDELFQICDPQTMAPRPKAAKHDRPRGL